MKKTVIIRSRNVNLPKLMGNTYTTDHGEIYFSEVDYGTWDAEVYGLDVTGCRVSPAGNDLSSPVSWEQGATAQKMAEAIMAILK